MSDQLWKLCKHIVDTAENKKDFVTKCDKYWRGELQNRKAMLYPDQKKSSFNIIKPIVETKLKAVLDAEFSLAVVPAVKSFSSLKTIKDQQAIADIFNDELLNILNDNNMDSNKEIISRNGLNCGFGVAQTSWEAEEDSSGRIKIKQIPSEKLMWDKTATSVSDSSFFGYSFTMSPEKAKTEYAIDEEGNYDEKLCARIDRITNDTFKSDGGGAKKSIANYSVYGQTGQAYTTGDTSGITACKSLELICLFLIDNSYYAPEKNDDKEKEDFKEQEKAKYPNGRMIIFSLNDKEKLILKDEALPESFNSLGNIAIFNSIKNDSIAGYGEIEDLMAIQDRIDGLYQKYRESIQDDFTMLAMEKNEDIAENDLVKNPVVFMKPDSMAPTIVSNGGMEKATQALGMIQDLAQQASMIARVNETMIYGYRQTGTTSGDQVQKLQESPLADIRSIQRNFKDFYIDIGNKCLELIKKNYTVDRLIKLSTGLTDEEYAKLQLNAITGEQEMVLVNEAGEAVRTIKMSEDWEFCVEVSAGTAVPRTRKEQALLMDGLIEKGIININDIDFVEQYLKAQDIPNYRMLVKLLRNKQAEAAERSQDPESRNWKEMMKNPEIAKVAADFMKAISGYPLAQQQILTEIGLPANPGKLDTTPVSEITSQSDVAEVATMANIISEDPIAAEIGRDAAIAEQLTDIN